jgi:hypothetical protein
VIVVFWLITLDKLVGKELFKTLACVLFKYAEKLSFERFGDDEIGGSVTVVFWPITDDMLLGEELFETVACVVFEVNGKL